MAGNQEIFSCREHPSAPAVRWLALVAVCIAAVLSTTTAARAQTKSLKLYYLHTGEKATITFKKNGRYLPSGLKKINWHLRDWRRNEPTKMDPQLLDLIWEAYRQSGSKAYIHVISGYRSPASNNLLRKRGRGVAKNSQHTKGKALDFFLPDVKLKKMREIGLKMGVGGVGYYPTSGSPFVHFDTGNVRHWPRMSRRELLAVFPKGDTMHVPTDGKPLARYQQAVAAYKRKKANGTLVPKAGGGNSGGNLFALFTARDNSDDEEETENSAPAPRTVETQSKPVAAAEPQFADLPRSVPVPVIAPRGGQADGGAEIVIAAATPESAPETGPETTPGPEPVLPEQTDPVLAREESAETALASVVVPVPARRPEFNTPPAQSDLKADTAPTTELALVDPAPRVESRGMQVAALTPSEIEDLRSRVRSTIGATGSRPVPTPRAPVPANPLPVSSAAEPVSDAGNGSVEAAATANSVIEAPQQPESQIMTASLAAPSVDRPDEAVGTIAIEPGVAASGKLPIPLRNPSAASSDSQEPRTAAVEVETANASGKEADNTTEESSSELVLASIPVPERSPLSIGVSGIAQGREVQDAVVVTAKLDNGANTSVTANQPPAPRPQLAKRTISLDRYSAPRENSTNLGKFALAANTTIRDLADVRAPAYGRNVIREVPKTFLVQGFNLQPFAPGANNFQGRAVTAARFAMKRIN